MPPVIKVKNLSKAYQLGTFGTGTISRDLERYWARIRGKDDPFLKIGEVNDRTTKGQSDMVWSLKDLNFNIEQGDAVGIIGRNGAGKSTLLKILSRITSPTTGTVKVKGRVASLLEVGTGFHPELSGRENIYLNGAILGMRKAEIKRKFDEIVNFAGVERYIDTPVKRYSSGMYVRLAFAVAAHLESEILVIDEVLAVGDAEFQKKCLGKMGDVSRGEGRTVLFVSHNMGSILQLCNTSMLLNNGKIMFIGSTEATVKTYMSSAVTDRSGINAIGTLKDTIKVTSLTVNETPIDALLMPQDEVLIKVKYECTKPLREFRISINVFKEGTTVLTTHDLEAGRPIVAGKYESIIRIPAFFLRPGGYTLAVGGHNSNFKNLTIENLEWFYIPDISAFEILEAWSENFDFNNKGLINLPNTGGKRTILG